MKDSKLSDIYGTDPQNAAEGIASEGLSTVSKLPNGDVWGVNDSRAKTDTEAYRGAKTGKGK